MDTPATNPLKLNKDTWINKGTDEHKLQEFDMKLNKDTWINESTDEQQLHKRFEILDPGEKSRTATANTRASRVNGLARPGESH